MLDRRRLLISAAAAWATGAQAEPAPESYGETLSRLWGGDLAPQAAHRRAVAAARAAQATLDRRLRQQGLASGSTAARLRRLLDDPRHLYTDDDAGRDRAVADMNRRLEALRPRLPAAFGDLPMPEARVVRMPASDVAAGKGGYRQPPADGRPGAYVVDLRNLAARPSWTLPSVAFHEVIPGHLLQLPLQAAAAPPAERLKAAGAFFEAWAIYAEQLAADLGAYAGDPLGEIGFLQWRLFRLGRAVADTGLGLGWDPARAVEAMTALQGRGIAFVTIEADVARMAQRPGQAAAEALGALEIARLRPRARTAWPAFHRALLAQGPWPPAELAQVAAG